MNFVNLRTPIYIEHLWWLLLLLFGDSLLTDSANNFTLNSTTDYVIATKRFDNPIVT